MSVTCKMFVQSRTESPDGSTSYTLGVVCRGDENKTWAQATPSGSMERAVDPVLDAVWSKKVSGEVPAAEVLVTQVEDEAGEWAMESFALRYGCQVEFSRKANGWGTLKMNVNATGATKVLREAFARGCIAGTAPSFSIYFTDATTQPE